MSTIDPWLELDNAVLRAFAGAPRRLRDIQMPGVPPGQILTAVRGHTRAGRLTSVSGQPHTYRITRTGQEHLQGTKNAQVTAL